jgi:hypothetical protein
MKMFAPSQLTSPWGPWGGRTRSVRVGFVALRIARFHNPHCRSSGLKARLSQREFFGDFSPNLNQKCCLRSRFDTVYEGQ